MTLNKLNNLENFFPMKIFKYFSINPNSVKDKHDFVSTLNNMTIGNITTTDSRGIKHSIMIFENADILNSFLKYLNTKNIEYNMNRYGHRQKLSLNELFNEYNYSSNITV